MASGCKQQDKKIRTRTPKTTEETEETDGTEETEGTSGTDTGKIDPPKGDFEVDPEEPLFIMTNSNWAWGFGMYHMVVMGNGDVYSFSSSCHLYPNITSYDEDLEHKLDHMKQIGPEFTLDSDYLQSLFDAAYAIDPNAEYDYENIMCDYGQHKIELVQTDKAANGVLVYEYGDNELTIDDENAAKFNDLYENFGDHLTEVSNTTYSIYTTEHPIISYNCGYISNGEGKYIFPDPEEFFKAVDQLGLDRSQFTVFEESCYEGYPVFMEITNVSTLGYSLLDDAFLALDNSDFRFLPSEDNYTPDPDEPACEAMDGFVSVFCYPSYVDIDAVVNDDSNSWQYFEFEH